MSRSRDVLALGSAALLGAGLALFAAACADFEAPEPPALPDVVVANPSFRDDIMPILEARCATAGCHTLTTRQRNLALSPLDSAHAQLIRKGFVNPAEPANSFLVCIIKAPCGNMPRMPLGQPPLTANQIQTITNWIGGGALKN